MTYPTRSISLALYLYIKKKKQYQPGQGLRVILVNIFVIYPA